MNQCKSMHKKYNSLQIMGKVYRQTLKIIPISGILSQIYYLINGLFPAVVVIITAKLFDSVYRYINGEATHQTIMIYACVLLGSYVIKQSLQFISSITINAGVYEKFTSYNNIRIAEKASRLSLLSYENSETMNLQSRAKDCANREILSQLYMTIAVFLTSGIGVVAVVVVLAGYSIWFVPISVFSVLPYFIARLIRGKEFCYVKRGQAKKTRRLGYLWGLFTERQTIKEMRVMGFDDYITDKWVECRDEVNEELWEQGKKDALSLLLCDVVRVIGYGISIALALILVLHGDISIGLFGACIGAFISVQGQIGSFLIELGEIPSRIEFARDYYEFLDLPEDNNGSTPYNCLENEITVSDVNFMYPNCDNYAVKNARLSIKKGEKIAILGENGSGKTTISKLILGLYPVNDGAVMYDGINVNEFDKSSFYKKASAIAQNFVSYNLSLRENIGIADTENIRDDEKLYGVLENAGLSSLAREVTLDSELGKAFGGAELSGGQWQKLAIARGLFKDSELIVLDEPTSALDPLIETEILSKFMEIAKDKTAIIISHRVGLCKLVDKVAVMKNGEIVEVGNHNELIKAGGEYTRLYTAQEQWYR